MRWEEQRKSMQQEAQQKAELAQYQVGFCRWPCGPSEVTAICAGAGSQKWGGALSLAEPCPPCPPARPSLPLPACRRTRWPASGWRWTTTSSAPAIRSL